MKAKNQTGNFNVGLYTGLKQSDGSVEIFDLGIIDPEDCPVYGCKNEGQNIVQLSTPYGYDFLVVDLIPKNFSEPIQASVAYRLVDL